MDAAVTVKSKRPSDSNFKQQRLPSWQPVLTARTVLPTFFLIGICFIPIGIALLHFSNEIAEKSVNYTNCLKIENDLVTNETCADDIRNRPVTSFNDFCKCRIDFQLDRDFEGDVYMYYELTNFYQNHRRYVKSRDDEQLLGRFGDPTALPPSDCAPFGTNDNKVIVPCGAIANSLFNDTLTLTSQSGGLIRTDRTGIAWPSDKDIKFKNPDGDLKEALKNFARPISWTRELWELDTENPQNNGLQNEDLIVWMRTAALPNFRKLYRRLKLDTLGNKLARGTYTLDIEYRYPVTQFDGTKSFILSTTSVLGGKNNFLGYAYIVVGSICLVLGCVLLFVHLKYRSHAQASTTSTNPRTPYT